MNTMTLNTHRGGVDRSTKYNNTSCLVSRSGLTHFQSIIIRIIVTLLLAGLFAGFNFAEVKAEDLYYIDTATNMTFAGGTNKDITHSGTTAQFREYTNTSFGQNYGTWTNVVKDKYGRTYTSLRVYAKKNTSSANFDRTRTSSPGLRVNPQYVSGGAGDESGSYRLNTTGNHNIWVIMTFDDIDTNEFFEFKGEYTHVSKTTNVNRTGNIYKGTGSGGNFVIKAHLNGSSGFEFNYGNKNNGTEHGWRGANIRKVKLPGLLENKLYYNANGGTGAPATQTAVATTVDNAGTVFTINADGRAQPTRTGYTFQGWNTNQTNANKGAVTHAHTGAISVGSARQTADASATLYAVWKINNYPVTCEDRVGSTTGTLLGSTTTGANYAYGSTVRGSSIRSTTYTGYTYQSDTSCTIGTGTNKVYRIFKANTYTNYLYYNANGGTGAPATQSASVTYPGGPSTFTINAGGRAQPTRTGYTFQGWNTNQTNANNGAVTHAPTGTISVGAAKQTANASATLYAVWKENTCTNKLVYNFNGGSANGITNPANQTGKYTNNFKSTFSVTATKPIRTGYTFNGWTVTTNSGSVTPTSIAYNAGATNVTVSPAISNGTSSGATVTVTAQWKPNITCEDRVTNETGTLLGTQAAKSYAVGQTAKGTDWGTPSANGTPYAGYRYVRETSLVVTATSGGAKVYRIFEPYYTVTYKGNGATSGTEKAEAKYYNVDYIIKGNDNWTGFVKTNNKFTGWSGSNNTNYDDPDNVEHHYNGNNNLVLYAQWEPTAYELTVKFETGINKTVVDGEESDNKDRVPIMVQPGTEVSLDAIVRPGYKFDIWKDISDTALPDFKDDTAATMLTMPEHNVTLVATAFCLTPQEDVVKNKYTTVPVSVSDGVVQDIVFHNSMTGSETYKQESVKDGDKLIKNTFTMQPYTEQTDGNITTVDEIAFRGWVLDPATFDKNDPKVDFYDEDAYKLAEGQQDKKTVDLYAVWQLHIVVTKPDGTVISQGWDYK